VQKYNRISFLQAFFTNKFQLIFNQLNSNILKFDHKTKKEEFTFFLTSKTANLKAQSVQNL
jgi:hypothetical protein